MQFVSALSGAQLREILKAKQAEPDEAECTGRKEA